MKGKLQLERVNSRYVFTLKAFNGWRLLTSERHKAKAAALKAVELVTECADNDAHYECKLAGNDKYYFVLKSASGEILATSRIYSSEPAMKHGIVAVKKNMRLAVFKDLTG